MMKRLFFPLFLFSILSFTVLASSDTDVLTELRLGGCQFGNPQTGACCDKEYWAGVACTDSVQGEYRSKPADAAYWKRVSACGKVYRDCAFGVPEQPKPEKKPVPPSPVASAEKNLSPVKPSEPKTCGENQELKNSACVCKADFVEQNGKCVQPPPITKEQCDTLKKSLKDALKGFTVSTDRSEFWNKIGGTGWDIGNLRNSYWLGTKGLHYEDGKDKPIRTGYEVALYNKIKDFIATHPNEKIDTSAILKMGLESASDNKKVNLQVALLTVHNVVRFLARPGQWAADSPTGKSSVHDYGHPSTDPLYPVFRELRGYESTQGTSLVKTMGIKLRTKETQIDVAGVPVNSQWTQELFDPVKGVFSPLPGASNSLWNGGAHYYFWVGAVADTVLTFRKRAADWGAGKEMKEGLKGNQQAAVQIGVFNCGADFGESAA